MSCRELERLFAEAARPRFATHRDHLRVVRASAPKPERLARRDRRDPAGPARSRLEPVAAPVAARDSTADRLLRRRGAAAGRGGSRARLAAARRRAPPEPPLALRRVHARPPRRCSQSARARHAPPPPPWLATRLVAARPAKKARQWRELPLGPGRRRLRVRRRLPGHAPGLEPDRAADARRGSRGSPRARSTVMTVGAELGRRPARRAARRRRCARSRCGRATSAATAARRSRTRSRSCGGPSRRRPDPSAPRQGRPPRLTILAAMDGPGTRRRRRIRPAPAAGRTELFPLDFVSKSDDSRTTRR